MRRARYPHTVSVLVKTKQSDGGGGSIVSWSLLFSMKAFLDTPTSKERYQAQQLQNPLDRYLYYPYRTDIDSTMRIKYENELYEVAGRPEDQGGQKRVMRVALKLVGNGVN